MFESAAPLRAEHAELEARLADPAVHSDVGLARKLARRYAELTPVVKALAEHEALLGDMAAAEELSADDPSFAVEADAIAARAAEIAERLTRLLAPRDPYDAADALMEI